MLPRAHARDGSDQGGRHVEVDAYDPEAVELINRYRDYPTRALVAPPEGSP